MLVGAKRDQIGELLFEHVIDRLSDNGQIALLGPRNGGKSMVLHGIHSRIKNAEKRPIPRLIWLSYDPADNRHEDPVSRKIHGMLAGRSPGETSISLSGRIKQEIISAVLQSNTPVWFFVSDILGFPAPSARALLTALQACKDDSQTNTRMAAVVTGSADFIPLTHTQDSPFHHAEKIILHGMDKQSAREFVRSRQQLRCTCNSTPENLTNTLCQITDDAFDYLYEQTRGQPHLMQEILASPYRWPWQFNPIGGWNRPQMLTAVRDFTRKGMANDLICRATMREIQRDPHAYDYLVKLVHQGGSDKGVPPGEYLDKLEVSGLVIVDEDNNVRIACPAWNSFLRETLTRQMIADEHAFQDRWIDAWKEYEHIPSHLRDRPISGDARFRFRSLITVWKESIWKCVPNGPTSVYRQFSQGARRLLGFDFGNLFEEVKENKYEPIHTKVNRLKSAAMPFLAESAGREIGRGPTPILGWLFPARLQVAARYLIGDDEFSRRRICVTLGRNDPARELDFTELQIVDDVLKTFLQAYGTADNLKYRQSVGDLREKHLKVIGRVNELVAGEARDMGEVISEAVRHLITTAGYLRVQICLVNPQRTRIQAVASASAPKAKKFDSPTNFLIDDKQPLAECDIQPWVVRKRELKVVADACNPDQKNPKIQLAQAKRIGMGAIAVVPMIAGGEVLGTIHFERENREPPEKWEQDLFKVFAGQMATALQQARKLTLLEGSIRNLPNRLAILGPDEEHLYSNASDAEFCGLPGGWDLRDLAARRRNSPRDDAGDVPEEGGVAGEMKRYFLEQENPRGGHLFYDFASVPIDDFRRKLKGHFRADARIGYVERFHDLTEFYEILTALRRWMATEGVEKTTELILTFLKSFGFRWARLYLRKSQGGGEFLQSYREFGLKKKENREAFRQGLRVFSRTAPDPEPWYVVTEARDVSLFQYNRKLEPGTIRQARTYKGLPRYYIKTIQGKRRYERTKKDLRWIEAPILFGEEIVGKISLSWDEWMTSFDWQLLRLAVFGMSAALHHEIQAEEKEKSGAEEAWKRAANMVIHRIGNKVNPAISDAQQALQNGKRGDSDAIVSMMHVRQMLLEIKQIVLEFRRYAAVKPFTDVDSVKLSTLVHRLGQEAKRRFPKIGRIVTQRSSPKTSVTVSMNAMLEVMENLLRNSCMHSGVRESEIEISIRAEQHKRPPSLQLSGRKYIRIEYRDNGKGIAPAYKEAVFAPYQSSHAEGTGLGLTISRRLVRRQDGEMTEEGEHDKGAMFCIYLPISSRRKNAKKEG
jgi:signal transduction histidine kinase